MSVFHLSEESTASLVDSIEAVDGEKFLILVRGLPGMGKSTLGRKLCDAFDAIQIENDMQFTINGEYIFDPAKLEDAHMATQIEVKNLLAEGAPCVVVTNTFTRFWEMQAYQAHAARFKYTLIVIDLFLYVKRNYIKTQKKSSFPTTQFLDFLTCANVHTVPADKIRSMHDRYEYSNDVITVTQPDAHTISDIAETGTTLATAGNTKSTLLDAECDFKLLDTGYYLALDLRVPEDVHDAHSGIYHACIEASQQILQLYGINCGYRMIRKLTVRNAKSHGMCYAMQQAQLVSQQPCTNPHVNARSAVKLSAGWTRYHITILSPTEYTALQKSDKLQLFLLFLNEIDFRPLVDRYLRSDSVSVGTAAVGYVQGAITEPTVPFPLDALGESAGLSEQGHSTALYLRLDPTISTLRELALLRVRFGFSGFHTGTAVGVGADVEGAAMETADRSDSVMSMPVQEVTVDSWQPHITLAFTHNDVRAVAEDRNTWDKCAGVERFRERYSQIIGVGGQRVPASPSVAALAESAEHLTGIGQRVCEPTSTGQTSRTDVTDLAEDSPTPSLATLMLYGELQASFKVDQCGFIVADLKARKGAMGDDATYRAHSFLQTYLPRGMVYLQHMSSRVIYRGLFSLRKFYGKEGVEDDGIGIGATQMNYKLGKVLDNTQSVLVMEKVNGRAASCRFFRYGHELFVIVGTKLSHTLCKIDQQSQCLVLPSQATSAERAESPQEDEEEPIDDKGAQEMDDTTAVLEAGNPLSLDLILSNVNALQSGIVWEHLEEFVTWLQGRTFNGEVLDPKEMHLVVITQHEWMSLCVTDFLVCGGSTAVEDAVPTEDTGASALQNMTMLGRFTKCVPAYESYDVNAVALSTHSIGTGSAGIVVSRDDKKKLFAQITDKIVFSRDSEGKVLYFLDAQGQVLDLLKFKTWWYIWRRSIREVASQIFSRYYNVSRRGKASEEDPDAALIDRLKDDIAHLNKIKQQMMQAKPAAQLNQRFRDRLDELNSGINAHQSQLDKLTAQKDGTAKEFDVSFTVIELCAKVQRKWPTKFSFFQAELGERYQEIVEKVIATAVLFLQWCQAQFRALKDSFYVDFKQVFPLVWERFLAETGSQDVF